MIQKLRNKEGFTLIELMIVIAIIGILAAIAIPNFIAYRDKAYCSYAEGDAQNILAGISCYFSEPNNQQFASNNFSSSNGLLDLSDSVAGNTCNVTLNGDSGSENVGTVVTNGDNSFTVSVTDGSGRCPRGSTYTTYMGTTLDPGWT